MVKLGGDNNNIVPKAGVTPAEILVLQAVHGSDCVVDVRPTGKTSRKTHQQEFERLSARYDRGAGAFVGSAGEKRETICGTLFPGAMKRLPTTLAEVGFGGDLPAAPEPVPNLPDVNVEDNETDADEDTVDVTLAPEGENGAGDAEAENAG
jgi:hypothetical protein